MYDVGHNSYDFLVKMSEEQILLYEEFLKIKSELEDINLKINDAIPELIKKKNELKQSKLLCKKKIVEKI